MTDREQFLADRRRGIGSSDVAAVLGLSPWKTALDVYLDKVAPGPPGPLPPALEWGIRLEPVIAAAAMDRHGWHLRKLATLQHSAREYLIASIDRLTQHGEPVECKSASRADGWGEPETADIPEHYWLQVQHQMEVLASHGQPPACAWVCVLIGHHDYRRYRIPRDPEYLTAFGPALADFWLKVHFGQPPEPDWHHSATLEAVQRLHKPVAGECVELSEEAARLADRYQGLGATIAGLAEERDDAKARLIALLGSAELGTLPDGRCITRKVMKRKAYEVKESEYTRFEVKQPRGAR